MLVAAGTSGLRKEWLCRRLFCINGCLHAHHPLFLSNWSHGGTWEHCNFPSLRLALFTGASLWFTSNAHETHMPVIPVPRNKGTKQKNCHRSLGSLGYLLCVRIFWATKTDVGLRC